MRASELKSLPFIKRAAALARGAGIKLAQSYTLAVVNNLLNKKDFVTSEMAKIIDVLPQDLVFDHIHLKTNFQTAFDAAVETLKRTDYEILVNSKHFVVFKEPNSNITVAIDAPSQLKYPWDPPIALDHLGFVLKDEALFKSLLKKAKMIESRNFGEKKINKGIFETDQQKSITRVIKILTNLRRFELLDKSPAELIRK
jgi:hypothetical protein